MKYIDKALEMGIEHETLRDLKEHIIDCHCPADDTYQLEPRYITVCDSTECKDCWDREMPREIKFRAWNKVKKIMVTDVINNCGDSFDLVLKHLQIYEVMQYTGLKDKNGVEIYEGDLCSDGKAEVIQILWSDKHQWGCRVIKTESVLSKGLTFPLWHWDNCQQNGYRQLEVIGNIYENPELLEG